MEAAPSPLNESLMEDRQETRQEEGTSDPVEGGEGHIVTIAGGGQPPLRHGQQQEGEEPTHHPSGPADNGHPSILNPVVAAQSQGDVIDSGDELDDEERQEMTRDSILEEVPMEEEEPILEQQNEEGGGADGKQPAHEERPQEPEHAADDGDELDGLLSELDAATAGPKSKAGPIQAPDASADADLNTLLMDEDEKNGKQKEEKREEEADGEFTLEDDDEEKEGQKKDDTTRTALYDSIFGGDEDDDDDDDLSALLAGDHDDAEEAEEYVGEEDDARRKTSGRGRKRRNEGDEGDIERKSKRKLEEILQQKDRKEQRKKQKQLQRKRRAKTGDADADAPKKKRRASTGEDAPKRKRPSKKSMANAEGEVAEGAEGEGEGAGPEERSDFDLVVEKMKKSNKRRKSQLSTQQIEIMAETLLNKMADAVEADISANREKSPAVAKVKLLSEAMAMLQKIHIQDAFIERGGLRVLKQWLEPLPDGSLPNFNIRRDILGILGKLPISSDHLRESGLGKVVMFLYKSPKETKENKAIAQELIQTWSRPIFKLSLSYSDLAEHERERLEQRRLRRTKAEAQSTSQTDDLDSIVDRRSSAAVEVEQFSYHARIPQPADKDYILRPVSQVELPPKSSAKTLSKQKLFERRLSELKLKRKGRHINAQSRAARLSIEGRNLHH